MFLLDPVETKAEVTEIVLADVELADLVDNRDQVVERANGMEDRGIRMAEDTAGSSQDEGVFHDEHRHAAIVESRRKKTIVAADNASSSGRTAIRFENPADIILFGDLHDVAPRAVQPWDSRRGGPSTLTVWQKWRRRLRSASRYICPSAVRQMIRTCFFSDMQQFPPRRADEYE